VSTSYNPEVQPFPTDWLAIDESERSQLVVNSHVGLMGRGKRAKAHAAMHVVVENQLALGVEATVRAIERLGLEGLSRHESIHAIASVLAEYMFNISRLPPGTDPQALQFELNQSMDRLDAKSWFAKS
jgi:hypothetical protein